MQAIGLAKLQELSIKAIAQKTRLPPRNGEVFSYRQSRPNFFLAIRRELPKELEEKRAKGCCFKCNEKFTNGHQCKKKQLNVLDGDQEDSDREPI